VTEEKGFHICSASKFSVYNSFFDTCDPTGTIQKRNINLLRQTRHKMLGE